MCDFLCQKIFEFRNYIIVNIAKCFKILVLTIGLILWGGRTIGRRTIGRGQLVAAGQSVAKGKSVAVQSLWTISRCAIVVDNRSPKETKKTLNCLSCRTIGRQLKILKNK